MHMMKSMILLFLTSAFPGADAIRRGNVARLVAERHKLLHNVI